MHDGAGSLAGGEGERKKDLLLLESFAVKLGKRKGGLSERDYRGKTGTQNKSLISIGWRKRC